MCSRSAMALVHLRPRSAAYRIGLALMLPRDLLVWPGMSVVSQPSNCFEKLSVLPTIPTMELRLFRLIHLYMSNYQKGISMCKFVNLLKYLTAICLHGRLCELVERRRFVKQ